MCYPKVKILHFLWNYMDAECL